MDLHPSAGEVRKVEGESQVGLHKEDREKLKEYIRLFNYPAPNFYGNKIRF